MSRTTEAQEHIIVPDSALRAAHYAQLQAVSHRAGVQGHVERVSIERSDAGWRVSVDTRYDDGGRYRYRADYNGDAIKPSAVAFEETSA